MIPIKMMTECCLFQGTCEVMDTLKILWSDLIAIATNVGIQELTLPIALTLWATALMLPLPNIDKRDMVAGVTYVLFMTFSAVLIIAVLPAKFDPSTSSYQQTIYVGIGMVAASARWFWRRDPKKEQIDQLIRESEA